MQSKKDILIKFYFYFIILGIIAMYPNIGNTNTYGQTMIHPKAVALANSVTASPPGHMAIHYNPAGLYTVREGVVFSQGLSFGIINRKDSFTPDPLFTLRKSDNENFTALDDHISNTSSSVEKNPIFIPHFGKTESPCLISPFPIGFSKKTPGSRWTFASAIYSPYIWGESYDNEGATRYQKKMVYRQHIIYASPSFSYQVTDHFSVGLALHVGETIAGLETDLRTPNELTASLKYMKYGDQDDYIASMGRLGPFDHFASFEMDVKDFFVPSFNLGIVWEPISWLTFGLVYQHQVSPKNLKGKYKIQYTNEFLKTTLKIKEKGLATITQMFKNNPQLSQYSTANNGPINLDTLALTLSNFQIAEEGGNIEIDHLDLPAKIQAGILLRPIKRFRIMFDFHWTNWEALDPYSISFESPVQAIKLFEILGHPYGSQRIEYAYNYKNTFHTSVGLEYQLKECLAIRLGYENRKTNMRDETFDLYTIPDLHVIGAGFGLKLPEGVDVDFGLGYLVNRSQTIESNVSENLNRDDLLMPVYNPYAGQNYHTSFHSYILSASVTMPFEVLDRIISRLNFF